MDAVLFDLDGTLLDTLDDLTDAANAALAAEGFPTHDREAYRFFVGNGAPALIRRALPADRRDPEIQARCLAAMRSAYAAGWSRQTRPYEGVPELLDGLEAAGEVCAVLSNKPDDFVGAMVAHYFGKWPFRAVRGHRPGVPLKPAPDAALEVVALCGSDPARTLLLGDSAVDMETARAAGLFPAGALWGFRPREELAVAGARLLLDDPRGLLPFLGLRAASRP